MRYWGGLYIKRSGVRVVTRAQNQKYKLLSGPLFLPAVVEMSWEKNPKKKAEKLKSRQVAKSKADGG